MKIPKPVSVIVPRTTEGFRGAFFGMLLSLVCNATGTVVGIAVLGAFVAGMFFSPHFEVLDEEECIPSPNDRVRRFFDRN